MHREANTWMGYVPPDQVARIGPGGYVENARVPPEMLHMLGERGPDRQPRMPVSDVDQALD